jgi:hypothetical protein
LAKAVAVLGADVDVVVRAASDAVRRRELPVTVTRVDGVENLVAVGVSSAWLGTLAARDEAFALLGRAIGLVGEAAAAQRGVALPPGVKLSRSPAVLAGDTHVLEVLSAVEQEVLGNLVRSHVPTLIALAGRGVAEAGAPRDRIGSRWLSGSRSHLAARFFASTAPAHLDRVKAELRRRDGVARLDRMDVVPDHNSDGTPVVVVRCVDAAATLATARAHATVLAALAVRARRLVREGRRLGHTPQQLLEENRARAVADGLRARFAVDDRAGQGRGRPRAQTPPATVSARDAVRKLVLDLRSDFANIEASAEELAPVLLPIELPRMGLRRIATDADLLVAWAAQGEQSLVSAASGALTDPVPGGQLLRQASATAPGRVAVVLDAWRATLSGETPVKKPRDNRDRRTGGGGARRGSPESRNGNQARRRNGGNPPRNDGSQGGSK